jgi:hypothetical protein
MRLLPSLAGGIRHANELQQRTTIHFDLAGVHRECASLALPPHPGIDGFDAGRPHV